MGWGLAWNRGQDRVAAGEPQGDRGCQHEVWLY